MLVLAYFFFFLNTSAWVPGSPCKQTQEVSYILIHVVCHTERSSCWENIKITASEEIKYLRGGRGGEYCYLLPIGTVIERGS